MVQSRGASFRAGSILRRDWWAATQSIRLLDVKIIDSVPHRLGRSVCLASGWLGWEWVTLPGAPGSLLGDNWAAASQAS